MPPEVSVIVCVRNGQDTIRRQLEALAHQRTDAAYEVVVVENGSSDATAAVVRSWIGDPGREGPPARLVDGARARGIPAVRNLGIRAAHGRILAFCDADDRVAPDWVEAVRRGLPGEGIAGGRLVVATDASPEEDPWSLPPHRDLWGDGLPQSPYLPHAGGANMAYAARTIRELGGFDESLPPYGFDDVEISWRAQEEGWQLLYLPEARVLFTQSGNAASLRKKFRLGQGRVLMARRFPAYDPTRYTVASTVGDALRSARRLLGTLVREHGIDRREASVLVAGVGRAWGAIRYPLRRGAPAPVLMPQEGGGR